MLFQGYPLQFSLLRYCYNSVMQKSKKGDMKKIHNKINEYISLTALLS